MALIFISYTHSDAIIAKRIESELKKWKHEVWIDQSKIKVGENIPNSISGGLSSCDFFISLISKQSLNSKWMKDELSSYLMITKEAKKIIPVKCDETLISDFYTLLASVKYVDFSTNEANGFNELHQVIGDGDYASHEKKIALEKDILRLNFAIDIALRAGTRIMRFYNSSMLNNQNIDERKNAATIADDIAQKDIISKITSHETYISDTIIAEEGLYKDNTIDKNGYTWVIDALDGTTNFKNRIPLFCTAIGILKEGKPFIGVIFDPSNNELYFALQGEPSKLWNIARGEVSLLSTSNTIKSLKECIVGTHISGRKKVAQRLFNNDLFLNISYNVNNIRAFGCGQLALAYVASGRIPIYFQLDTHLWDQLAGIVIIQNAGGLAFSLSDGHEWEYKHSDFCVTSNQILKQKFINQYKKLLEEY